MKKLLSLTLATAIFACFFISTDNTQIEATTLDNNPLQSRTMFEVKNSYLSSLNTFDYSQSIYNVEPSDSYPYIAGQLKDEVLNDTLNQINYFRWLCGINKINIDAAYLTQNQWGAVAQSANNVLSHTPAQPAGMSNSDYQLALAGAGAGYNYSGNCAAGYNIQDSIKGYIDDIGVSSMGHRYSLLNRDAFATSFGSCGIYSTLSMFINYNNTAYSAPYYSWPAAGYFPIESINPSADWSITLSGEYSPTASTTITLTADNNSSYTITPPNIRSSDYYNSISYTLPAELKSYLSNNTNLFAGGKSVTVSVSGLSDNSGQSVDFSYTTKFFVANPIVPTSIKLWRNLGNYFQSVNNGITMDYNSSVPMFIQLAPDNATDISLEVTSSNPIVADWDSSTSSIIGISGGTSIITFTSSANPEISASCTVTVNGPSSTVTNITSNYYDIDEDNSIITGIYPRTTTEHFISYLNERSNIKIFRNGQQISGGSMIGTSSEVQLVYNNVILQSLYAVVQSDLDGNGYFSAEDITILNGGILSKDISYMQAMAGDLDGDGEISVYDSILMKMNKFY